MRGLKSLANKLWSFLKTTSSRYKPLHELCLEFINEQVQLNCVRPLLSSALSFDSPIFEMFYEDACYKHVSDYVTVGRLSMGRGRMNSVELCLMSSGAG